MCDVLSALDECTGALRFGRCYMVVDSSDHRDFLGRNLETDKFVFCFVFETEVAFYGRLVHRNVTFGGHSCAWVRKVGT